MTTPSEIATVIRISTDRVIVLDEDMTESLRQIASLDLFGSTVEKVATRLLDVKIGEISTLIEQMRRKVLGLPLEEKTLEASNFKLSETMDRVARVLEDYITHEYHSTK